MFAGILKYVLGPTQTHVSHSRWARVKMSSERGPKHIYAQGHKLYYYYSHFESHRETKTEKMAKKRSEEYFFHERC